MIRAVTLGLLETRPYYHPLPLNPFRVCGLVTQLSVWACALCGGERKEGSSFNVRSSFFSARLGVPQGGNCDLSALCRTPRW